MNCPLKSYLFSLRLGILVLLPISLASAQQQQWDLTISVDSAEQRWVDSVFNSMTPDERLGQLFMLRAHSNLGPDHVRNIERLVETYQVGGLCFFQGDANTQAELINRYNALSKGVPLMIAMDAEWGLGMRFPKTNISFPKQLTLGAIQDNQLLYDMGKEIARQLRRAGVHVNFAPVADVNNNAANPVINMRSFGEDRYNVAVKSYMYAQGMQDNQVLACAKHFPGHGDTDVDSHYDLPQIRHSMQRLDSIELYPFQALFKNGIGSVMVAHLNVPAIDSRERRPTTLSEPTITGLIKEQFAFKGLVFTDALDMKGVTKYFSPGQVEAEALLAGSDALLLPEDVGAAIREIKNYLSDGRLSPTRIEYSVKKLLRTKYRLGITHFVPIDTQNMEADLNNSRALALKQKLIENALTLVRNRDRLLPFTDLDTLELASLSLGAEGRTAFQNRLNDYRPMPHFQAGKSIPENLQENLLKQFRGKDVVIVGIHNMSEYASRDFGITVDMQSLIARLSRQTKVVLVVFGNPYSLKYFDRNEWVLSAYQGGMEYEDAAAQALFGAISLTGRLPITASDRSRFNTGLETPRAFRVGYARPESAGLNADTAIDSSAMPGRGVLVDNKGAYREAFGYHTLPRRQKVQKDDIDDLVSVTKIAAATPAVMKPHEEGLININEPLSRYLPELTNKEGIPIRDIMPLYRTESGKGKKWQESRMTQQ